MPNNSYKVPNFIKKGIILLKSCVSNNLALSLLSRSRTQKWTKFSSILKHTSENGSSCTIFPIFLIIALIFLKSFISTLHKILVKLRFWVELVFKLYYQFSFPSTSKTQHVSLLIIHSCHSLIPYVDFRRQFSW